MTPKIAEAVAAAVLETPKNPLPIVGEGRYSKTEPVQPKIAEDANGILTPMTQGVE
jgi:hypothetical protein